jgi:hypothetical protein
MEKYAKVDTAPKPKQGTVRGYILAQKLLKKVNQIEMTREKKDALTCKILAASNEHLEKALSSENFMNEINKMKYKHG